MARTKQTARKMSENNPLCRKIDVLNMTIHNIFEMLATSGYENAKIFADNKIVDVSLLENRENPKKFRPKLSL